MAGPKVSFIQRFHCSPVRVLSNVAHPCNKASYYVVSGLPLTSSHFSKQSGILVFCYSKEHCRLLTQRVHEREIYFQPGRVSGADALSLHGAVEKMAKVKASLRQQPIGGPKIMFI